MVGLSYKVAVCTLPVFVILVDASERAPPGSLELQGRQRFPHVLYFYVVFLFCFVFVQISRPFQSLEISGLFSDPWWQVGEYERFALKDG